MTEVTLKSSLAVYPALAKVMKSVSDLGILKGKERTGGGGYWYRGIDDVTWVLSPLFADNKLLVRPSYANSHFTKRKTANGFWYIAKTDGTFVITSLVDGSELVLGPVPGEAGDSGDKAMSKACSVSLRNAMLQTFLAPIGPNMDPETAEEPAPEQPAVARPKQKADTPADPPRSVEGSLVGPELKPQQRRILDAKLKGTGVSESALEAKLGGKVDGSNFNKSMDFIADLAKSGA